MCSRAVIIRIVPVLLPGRVPGFLSDCCNLPENEGDIKKILLICRVALKEVKDIPGPVA
jgi:hypothetical protein